MGVLGHERADKVAKAAVKGSTESQSQRVREMCRKKQMSSETEMGSSCEGEAYFFSTKEG